VQHSLAEIPQLVPSTDMRIVAIYRQDNPLHELTGATRIEPGDEVFVLAATAKLRAVLAGLRRIDRPVRRVMIAGGGKVGLRLARLLRGEVQMKILEVNKARCDYLATQLPADVLILNGDSTDEELMGDENVQDMDLFLALTSDDEDNIMACLLAKRMGAKRVLALINRKAYADLVQGTTIDIALSPSHAVIGELLAYVRRGDIEAVHSLRRGAAEALEAIVRGDKTSCRMAGRRIEEVQMPRGVQIGAIVRGLPTPGEADALPDEEMRADGELKAQPQVIIAHHDTVVQTGDRVIVFMSSRKQVREVEKLFQVSATFLG
jgi:trk system potassium uptake protein